MAKRKQLEKSGIRELEDCVGRLVNNHSRLLKLIALNALARIICNDIRLLVANYEDLEGILGKSTFKKLFGKRPLINKGLNEIVKKFC